MYHFCKTTFSALIQNWKIFIHFLIKILSMPKKASLTSIQINMKKKFNYKKHKRWMLLRYKSHARSI